MLNEKDKRTFLLVVFGVAFVSFVTAAIACLTNAITFFADYQMISAYRVNPIRTPLNDNPDFFNAIGALLLASFALGISYGCVKFFVRKTFLPSLVIASIILVLVIASTLTLRLTIPTISYGDMYSGEQINSSCYSFFEVSYVAVVLPLGIAVTLMEVAHLLLRFMNVKKAKEERSQVADTEE